MKAKLSYKNIKTTSKQINILQDLKTASTFKKKKDTKTNKYASRCKNSIYILKNTPRLT